jgi:uncharacterized protein (TIGR03437 family)
MKQTRFALILVSLVFLILASEAKAEILTATVPLTPGAEVTPPVPVPPNATGFTTLIVDVYRDPAGNIVGGTVNFETFFNFPGGPITITGHHIHEAAATVNGPVVIDPHLATQTFPTGSGRVSVLAQGIDPNVFRRFIANPAGFYVNLHTSNNPSGAIRGQIVRLSERMGASVFMDTSNEVPPITNIAASGRATITTDLQRDTLGQVTGGTVTFTVFYLFPGAVTITGLHIHESPAGVNGSIVIDTGVSASNPVVNPTGKGLINIAVPITAANIAAVRRMLANPAGFYVNLHTNVNPGGVIRAQLVPLSVTPGLPRASKYVITAGSLGETIGFATANLDDGSGILINDELMPSDYDPATGMTMITLPSSLLATPGVLAVQARRSDGPRSTPLFIVVADPANIVSLPATTVDAATYRPRVSPDSIAATFGDDLGVSPVSATSLPLPTSLDGTTMYYNGVAAGLFYVSDPQVNSLVPGTTVPGVANVVVVNKNGRVSQGTVTVDNVAPSIFTTNGLGTLAAAGLASANGTTFNQLLGNPNGTTNAIAANSFVMLALTGVRYASARPTVTLGGTVITPTFSGPQGTFAGLDQINFQIPASLAGRGEVDLIVTADGKTSNTVKLRVQ